MLEKNKKLLESIKSSNCDFTNVDTEDLLKILFKNIGNKDSYVRDDLVYPVFAHLLHDDILTYDKINTICEVLLSEKYLFLDMSNKDKYSVLVRTFTLLQLFIIVYKYNQRKSEFSQYILKVYNAFLRYYQDELDYRGYDKEVGFIHSVAHSADLMSQLMKSEVIQKDELEVMFNLVYEVFIKKEYQLTNDEDERTVTALEIGIKRNLLDPEFLIAFIEKFKVFDNVKEYPEYYNVTRNIKCLLRSLYFRFIDNLEYQYLTNVIKETLKEIK
ncbi:hypothetical protein CI105_07075 [Candidatus Izimaplasma bacterium ZiA1]|uniref:DUF2785 domain-containing protein n=1 Tax=Candidatus Izimoplasma sp. ZiA1 TaxID=2024899 RepID=UPI000BAA4081|nr:hypothetical protein CI105_07075 [Candidatus Izimaplasma bacterium ZiA1]